MGLDRGRACLCEVGGKTPAGQHLLDFSRYITLVEALVTHLFTLGGLIVPAAILVVVYWFLIRAKLQPANRATVWTVGLTVAMMLLGETAVLLLLPNDINSEILSAENMTRLAAVGRSRLSGNRVPHRGGRAHRDSSGQLRGGTVTEVKRPGRMKGRSELYIRFDSLTLPNGVTRDFRARIGSLHGRTNEELDRSERKNKSEGNKTGELKTVAETVGAGATVGSIAGPPPVTSGWVRALAPPPALGRPRRRPALARADAVLAEGTTVEMVLDRNLDYGAKELESITMASRTAVNEGAVPTAQ